MPTRVDRPRDLDLDLDLNLNSAAIPTETTTQASWFARLKRLFSDS